MREGRFQIFVSYSHSDAQYLRDDSLLGFLEGLEHENVEFWTDLELAPGEAWDEQIRQRLEAADLALILVSQAFLDSRYCIDTEISTLLENAHRGGLPIFPVLLSPCEWERHEWLRSRQIIPAGSRTIEEDFTDPGERKRLFLEIRQELRKQIQHVRNHAVDDGAIATPPTETFETPPSPQAGPWHRRKNMAAITLVATSVIAAFTAELLLRSPEKPETLSLSASPAKIAILGFEERPGFAWMASAFRDVLHFELESISGLQPVELGEVDHAMARLALPEIPDLLTGMDGETLERISEETGADVVAWGWLVESTGDEFEVTLQIQSTETGQSVTLPSEKTTRSQAPKAAIELSSRIARTLGLNVPALATGSPTPGSRAPPGNVDAARLHARGLEKLRRLDSPAARDLLTEALAIQPGSPAILIALADAHWDLGDELTAGELAEQAVESSRDLGPTERFSALARSLEARRQWQRSAALLRLLRPDDETQAVPNEARDEWLDGSFRIARLQAWARQSDQAFAALVGLREISRGNPRTSLIEAEAAKRVPDFARQKAAAQRAAEEARQPRADFLIARAKILEGEARDGLGEYEEAIASYRAAEEIYTSYEHSKGEAQAHMGTGTVLWKQGRLSGAKQSYDQAIRLYAAAGNRRIRAKTMVNKGWLLYEQGDFDAAIEVYEQALEPIREAGDRESESLILLNLAITLEKQGSLSDALAYCEIALKIESDLGGAREEARIRAIQGPILEQQGKLMEASTVLQRALENSRKAKNRQLEAEALAGLASIRARQAELDEAAATYDETLQIFEDDGNQIGVADVLRGLGDILLVKDELTEAEAHYLRALEIQDRVTNREHAARTRRSLARLLLAQERYEDAERWAREAADDLEHSQSKLQKALARGVLARALLAGGRVEEARREIDVARWLLGTTDGPIYRLPVEIAAARIDAAEGNVRGALDHLRSLLGRATHLGLVELELESELARGEIEAEHGIERAGVNRLESVEQEAEASGLELIARRAVEARKRGLDREVSREESGDRGT